MVIATAYRSTVNCLLVSNRFTVYRFPRPIPNTVLRLPSTVLRLPFPVPPSVHRPPSTVHRQLVAYFRSGWAFLIPYLAAYLLYAWLKWPVNPVAAGSSPVDGGQLAVSAIGALPSTVTPSTAHSLLSTGVPCLLHVYWFLHALHLVLGALALRAWWRESGATVAGATDDSESVSNRAAPPLLSTVSLSDNRPPSAMDRLWAAMPWLLLALLFYIPGVYLEWPSDPWEHLRRINEWRVLDTVTAHSSWMKSSYIIPYSLLSWCVGLRQIFWLDFYYTGICLLLCWQYYRLARACDLGERASMIFVLLQALLFGSNIFSFYRYYGISSSIYAQLGAVALTRIVLEAAKHPQLSLRSFFSVPSIVHRLRSSAHRQPPTFAGRLARTNTGMAEASNGDQPPADLPSAPPPTVYRPPSSVQPSSAFRLLLPVLCLLPLIRYNHAQGLGIAGLGVGAVIIWRLIEWRRSALWWLIVATLVINVLFLWLYPRPAMVEIHRAQGFLNAWHGFNILNLASSAGDRMLQIVSVFGLVNLAAALVLIYRNHVIAWLTILPVAVMLLPCIAVPLEQILAQASGPDNVITFQRFFFSIPPCLALACLWEQLGHDWDIRLVRKPLSGAAPAGSPLGLPPAARLPMPGKGFLAPALVCSTIIALTVAPNSSPSYNRFFNTTAVVPNDLRLQDVFTRYEAVSLRLLNNPDSKIIATEAGTALLASYTPDLIGQRRSRKIGSTATDSITEALDFLDYNVRESSLLPAAPFIEATPLPSAVNGLNLIDDPMASNPQAWIVLGGRSPEFVFGITDIPTISTALQNPVGVASFVFTSAMIPVQRLKSYRLEMTVKQVQNTDATVYLAIAWYDAGGRLLVSNAAQPQGAGYPRGWSSGTFSYFGLISQTPPTTWTTYGIPFGYREAATIPLYTRFVRVGALLNYNSTPSSLVQLTNIKLFKKKTPEIGLAIPHATSAYSPASQAARLSVHWPPNQVMVDRGGTSEILAAAVTFVPDVRK